MRKSFLFLAAVAMTHTLSATEPSARDNRENAAALILGSDTDAHDQLGYATAISGHHLVVAAPYARSHENHFGSVYVFERLATARDSWQEAAKLAVANPSLYQLFGFSTAIDQDTIVVGALIDDDEAHGGEAAYIFERDHGGLSAWGQTAKLEPSNPEVLSFFGAAVAIADPLVAVGAPEDDAATLAGGAVYLYERDGGDAWRQLTKLTAPDPQSYSFFGFSVAFSGTTVAVGAPEADGRRGAVYVFEHAAEDPSTWALTSKLISPSTTYDSFGYAVAMAQDTLVVGAPELSPDGEGAGSVHIFKRSPGELTWRPVKELRPSDGALFDTFGSAVTIAGELVAVGSPDDDDQGQSSGSVYVFGRHHGGVDAWGEQRKLSTEDTAEGDRLGNAVALDQETLAVGARLNDRQGTNAGAAYLFVQPAASSTPAIFIPHKIPASFAKSIDVPLYFSRHGASLTAARFTVDFDELCLTFDDRDRDGDGNPDDVSLFLPPEMLGQVTFSSNDTGGELSFVITDPSPPLAVLPDGVLATVKLTVACDPLTASHIAPVTFDEAQPPSFATLLGQTVSGRGLGGSVEILPGARGDCDRDGVVNTEDLATCVVEIFDEDGSFWSDAAGGGFSGSPVGCDANADQLIDAGDLSCKMLLIFAGSSSCELSGDQERARGPSLWLGNTKSRLGKPAIVEMFFRPRSRAINSMAFRLVLDENLRIDPSDADGDGSIDAVRFHLPERTIATSSSVTTDDGKTHLDIVLIDPEGAFRARGKKPFLTLVVQAADELLTQSKPRARTHIRFSADPGASFGSSAGRSVPGTASGGVVVFFRR